MSRKISDSELQEFLGDRGDEPLTQQEQLDGIRDLLDNLASKEAQRLQKLGRNPNESNSISAYWKVLYGNKARNVSSTLRNRTVKVQDTQVTLQDIIKGRAASQIEFAQEKTQREQARAEEEEKRQQQREQREQERAKKEKVAEETKNFSVYLRRIQQANTDDFKQNKLLKEIDQSFESQELKQRLQEEFFDQKQQLKGLSVSDRQKDFGLILDDVKGLSGRNRQEQLAERIEQKVLERIQERARQDPDGNADAISILPIEVIVKNFPQQLTTIGGINKEAAKILKEKYK